MMVKPFKIKKRVRDRISRASAASVSSHAGGCVSSRQYLSRGEPSWSHMWRRIRHTSHGAQTWGYIPNKLMREYSKSRAKVATWEPNVSNEIPSLDGYGLLYVGMIININHNFKKRKLMYRVETWDRKTQDHINYLAV